MLRLSTNCVSQMVHPKFCACVCVGGGEGACVCVGRSAGELRLGETVHPNFCQSARARACLLECVRARARTAHTPAPGAGQRCA